MMKLGFVSAILPELPLADVFRIAAECGYSCVEVMCWPLGAAERRYAGVTHLHVDEPITAAQIAEVRRLTEETGVSISGLGYYPNPLSPYRDEARQVVSHLERVLEASAALGIHHVNTFVGRDCTRSVNDQWGRFMETWVPLVERAEKLRVTIGIENCPMLFTRNEWPGGKNLAVSPAIWRRMFTEIPSEAWGLNYDPSHLVWQQMDYLKPLQDFTDRLFHIHAKDVRVDKRRLDEVGILAHPNEYHFPKLPGLGDVDWGRFFSILGDVGYRGAVCVEVEDRAYEGSLESRIAALKQSAVYLRNFLPT